MYVATKHAVKGFTDALRVEVEELDKAPVSITLIQPTAVDTPFPQHARNFEIEGVVGRSLSRRIHLQLLRNRVGIRAERRYQRAVRELGG